jgi:hypothetical protein
MSEFLIFLDQMIEDQKKKALECGAQFVERLTSDDILQPNDYPQLEANPHFRYEEGVLAGLQMARSAIASLQSQNAKL